jgi:hypothetical protein
MTDRELMQMSLDALEYEAKRGNDDAYLQERKALRERLAKPEMQPCAGRNCGSTNPNLHSAECFEDYEQSTGMNKWQGLTDQEIADLLHPLVVADLSDEQTDYEIARAIETKLKEKNT